MLFATAEFGLFLAIVLALFYTVPFGFRRYVLLAFSYLFYMFWNPYFIVLLLTLTLIDFYAAIWVARASGRARKLALLMSVCANLGFLGFFKYANFLIENLVSFAGLPAAYYRLSVILPLGISFHTFQSISYVVDVYRGEQEPVRDPIDYALFIAFFPQLVAGPIVRAGEFFPDLFHWRAPSVDEVKNAVWLILVGVCKKLVLADQFALVADSYFGNVAATTGTLTAWSATVAFAMQIFFDFSGYTDIAVGCAALFGFHFPVNFRRPYLAASITEFWRRWHISLSRWLRNYLYFSLGGNRRGRIRTYVNLIVTMLLGGLWHGASWNFVVWGGYHGVLLALERMFGMHRQETEIGILPRLLRAGLVFILVCFGWVLFRSRTWSDSLLVLQRMLSLEPGPILLAKRHFVFIGVSFAFAVMEETRKTLTQFVNAPAWAHAAAFALFLIVIEIFGVTEKSIPFVYFQF